MAETQLLFAGMSERESALRRSFLEFHGANPEVYTLFKKFCFEAIHRSGELVSRRGIVRG